jgi:hypothetical protein
MKPMEKLTQMEKVSLGAVILLGMCGLLGVAAAVNSVRSKESEKASPAPVTKFSVQGPGVSWTAEKTNTVIRWPKPSETR